MPLVPKYTLWEAINVAIALGTRALEEIRTLARQPGPRGADGLGWEDMSEELAEDGRTIVRRYKRGDIVVKEFRHTFAVTLYRGVFREGEKYVEGDCVTWNGSMFVARVATEAKPETSKDWQLAVKRGRDGKEAVSIPRDPNKPVKINVPDNA